MDENLIEAIERTRKSIKKKYKELQRWRSAERRSFERIYDPLIKPIKDIGKKEQPSIKNVEGKEKKEEPAPATENDDEIEEETSKDLSDSDNAATSPKDESSNFADARELSVREYWLNEMIVSKNYDSTFGPKYIENKLKLGNQPFDIRETDSAIVIGEHYTQSSNGLLQLIFYKNPDDSVVTPDDTRIYAQILQLTSAHRQNNDPRGRILGNPGNKYKNYIQPFLEKKSGGNLKFIVSNKKTSYKYWDDPNELLTRLSLLIADKNAGNKTVHDIEIHSILSELFQKKYIKKISKP